MWALYLACAALILRNLVRTIQFGSVQTSAVNTKEVFIYIFDAFLMVVVLIALAVYHPGRLVRMAHRAADGGPEKGYGPAASNDDSSHILLVDYHGVR